MKKQLIKVIKRKDREAEVQPVAKPATKKPAEINRGVATTIENWISQRRENTTAEDRSRQLKFANWNTDSLIPA
jgi:hypothetical protein